MTMALNWLGLAVIGSVLGLVYGLFTKSSNMPQKLTLFVGAVGALLGGALVEIVKPDHFMLMFYAIGIALGLGCLVGGTLAFQLTDRERRV